MPFQPISPQLINSFAGQQLGAGTSMLNNAVNRETSRWDQIMQNIAEQAARERRYREQMRLQKEQLDAQKDAASNARTDQWIRTGIGVGSGAAGGAVVGSLAAAPAASPAIEAAGTQAIASGASPAMLSPQAAGAAAYPTFAGGNQFKGAVLGASLGGLDAAGGTNYLPGAIAMPGANALNASRIGSNEALTAQRMAGASLDYSRGGYWNERGETEEQLRPKRGTLLDAQAEKELSAAMQNDEAGFLDNSRAGYWDERAQSEAALRGPRTATENARAESAKAQAEARRASASRSPNAGAGKTGARGKTAASEPPNNFEGAKIRLNNWRQEGHSAEERKALVMGFKFLSDAQKQVLLDAIDNGA